MKDIKLQKRLFSSDIFMVTDAKTKPKKSFKKIVKNKLGIKH